MSDARERMLGRLHQGLIPAVPVTLRADGEIDAAAHEAYVTWMMAQPISGVAIWAHTGRGLRLTAEQRGQVLGSWAQGRGGKAIVAGVGAVADKGLTDGVRDRRYRDETVRMAEQALEGGADLLMMHPPNLFRGRPDQDRLIRQHFEALAALDAPLLLFYLYEAAGGISYSLELLRDLLAAPQVVGIKMATLDSVMMFQDVAALIKEELPRSLLVTGEDRFLGYSLMCGSNAALIGMASACTAPQAKLLRHWFDGHHVEFVHLNTFVDRFSQVTFRAPMEGYIQRMLWSLVESGVIPDEAAHDPWGPELAACDRELVRRWTHALEGAV